MKDLIWDIAKSGEETLENTELQIKLKSQKNCLLQEEFRLKQKIVLIK